jgi:hypothetical protein
MHRQITKHGLLELRLGPPLEFYKNIIRVHFVIEAAAIRAHCIMGFEIGLMTKQETPESVALIGVVVIVCVILSAQARTEAQLSAERGFRNVAVARRFLDVMRQRGGDVILLR